MSQEQAVRDRYAGQFAAERLALDVWRAQRLEAAPYLSGPAGPNATRTPRHPAEAEALVARVELSYVERVAKLEARQEATIQNELEQYEARRAQAWPS